LSPWPSLVFFVPPSPPLPRPASAHSFPRTATPVWGTGCWFASVAPRCPHATCSPAANIAPPLVPLVSVAQI
jgi:hypothetical protein